MSVTPTFQCQCPPLTAHERRCPRHNHTGTSIDQMGCTTALLVHYGPHLAHIGVHEATPELLNQYFVFPTRFKSCFKELCLFQHTGVLEGGGGEEIAGDSEL